MEEWAMWTMNLTIPDARGLFSERLFQHTVSHRIRVCGFKVVKVFWSSQRFVFLHLILFYFDRNTPIMSLSEWPQIDNCFCRLFCAQWRIWIPVQRQQLWNRSLGNANSVPMTTVRCSKPSLQAPMRWKRKERERSVVVHLHRHFECLAGDVLSKGIPTALWSMFGVFG